MQQICWQIDKVDAAQVPEHVDESLEECHTIGVGGERMRNKRRIRAHADLHCCEVVD